VERGLAPDTLLDTYSDERVHATRENLRYATKSTEFMAPPSHGFALMREAVLSLAVEHAWVRPLINPRQTSAIAFHDSRLNSHAARSAAFGRGPRPGEVLPECPVEQTRRRARTRHRSPWPRFTRSSSRRTARLRPRWPRRSPRSGAGRSRSARW